MEESFSIEENLSKTKPKTPPQVSSFSTTIPTSYHQSLTNIHYQGANPITFNSCIHRPISRGYSGQEGQGDGALKGLYSKLHRGGQGEETQGRGKIATIAAP